MRPPIKVQREYATIGHFGKTSMIERTLQINPNNHLGGMGAGVLG